MTTPSKWKQQIDREFGQPKWNDELSAAIQKRVVQIDDKPHKAPSFIPFVSMAMLAVLVLLTLSVWPLQPQTGEQASQVELKFQKVYFSKLPTQSYVYSATDNLFTIGMEKTDDPLLLEQLTIAFEQKEKIDTANLDHSKKMDVILFDEVGTQYQYKIHKTYTDELVFQESDSENFYKYRGQETSQIFGLIEQQFKLKPFLIFAGIILMILLILPRIIYKHYGVEKRKETFDHLTLNKLARWLPLPYIIYVNFKLAIRPLTLTWWEILVPFLMYQIAVLWLMKRQREPHPYIVERMSIFILALMLLIGFMILT